MISCVELIKVRLLNDSNNMLDCHSKLSENNIIIIFQFDIIILLIHIHKQYTTA